MPVSLLSRSASYLTDLASPHTVRAGHVATAAPKAGTGSTVAGLATPHVAAPHPAVSSLAVSGVAVAMLVMLTAADVPAMAGPTPGTHQGVAGE